MIFEKTYRRYKLAMIGFCILILKCRDAISASARPSLDGYRVSTKNKSH